MGNIWGLYLYSEETCKSRLPNQNLSSNSIRGTSYVTTHITEAQTNNLFVLKPVKCETHQSVLCSCLQNQSVSSRRHDPNKKEKKENINNKVQEYSKYELSKFTQKQNINKITKKKLSKKGEKRKKNRRTYWTLN